MNTLAKNRRWLRFRAAPHQASGIPAPRLSSPGLPELPGLPGLPSGCCPPSPASRLPTPHSPLTTHHSPLTTHHSPLTTHHSPLTTRRAAFSLIEINIVLLVIGVGLIALLGLFPVGLRQAGLATADTAQATFADQVLSILHGKASTITNWPDWVKFEDSVLKDARIGGTAIKTTPDANGLTIANYLSVPGNTIRYQLNFAPVVEPLNFGGRLMRASIRAIDRDLGSLTNSPLYCTDFVFMGPPPQ